jgi:hypothetical protein
MIRSLIAALPILLAAAARAVAAPAPLAAPAWIAEVPGHEARPEEDGLVVRQHLSIVLDASGKVTRREETAIKMLAEWVSRHGFLDPRIDWNDARSEMRVEMARTTMADGSVVDARENSLVPNTAPELQWAVPYASMRQLVVSHVGVEHGSTSVLAYTVSDRRPSGVPLWGVIDLEGELPVLDQSVTLELHEGTGLAWGACGVTLEPAVSREAGSVAYAFTRRDVPGANLGELPSGRAGIPRLVYSTARDWSDARSWIEARVEPCVAPTPDVRAKTDEVVAGSTLDAERLARIHAFVLDGIRTVAWPVAAFDYAARPAAEVLRSSVGHPLDKAVLLAAMLRAAGLEARVALAASEREIAADVPCPPQLDQVRVRAKIGPHDVWLDPATPLDGGNRFHLAGRQVLVLDGKASALEVLPDLDPASNRAMVRVTARVASAKDTIVIEGSADLDLGGLYNPVVGFDRTADRLRSAASPVAAAFGGATVREVFVGQRSADLTALRAEFGGGSIEEPPSGLIKLRLPRVPGAVAGKDLQLWRERRTLPLAVRAPARETVEVALELPEEIEVVFVPAEATIRNASGSLARTAKIDGRTLTVRTDLTLDAAVVKPADYPALRELLSAVEGEPSSTIVLRRKG